jgi:hypothetical protein
VDTFLETARQHFRPELHASVSDGQKAARAMILAYLQQQNDRLQLFD